MIPFYPGPSKVYPQIKSYLQEAFDQGILSINHRSASFMNIIEENKSLFKEKLNIPENYTVLYTSSATECWEIIAQSIIARQSIHIFNGAFGEKWFNYTKKIKPSAHPSIFSYKNEIDLNSIKLRQEDELIAITQNETSNGTQVNMQKLKEIRSLYPQKLIAVDITSSLGGIDIDFNTADIWLASVQKCLGMPAGLGLLICSQRAIEKSKQTDSFNYYNSLSFLYENIAKNQTSYTPNALNIFILNRLLKNDLNIKDIDLEIKKRFKQWYSFLSRQNVIQPFITNETVRSHTVLTLTSQNIEVSKIIALAAKENFGIGSGYGNLKKSTFRIANFPSISTQEISSLQEFLQHLS